MTAATAAALSTASESALVRMSSDGGLRTITLNREKALNALNQEMVNQLRVALDECVRSTTCNVILLRGVGRALCSGGDVLAVVKAANKPETAQSALDFFQSEFELDYKIARLGEAVGAHSGGEAAKAARTFSQSKGSDIQNPKTFVAVMDGITMGGGVGLSVHAPLRIATERTLFAMPETGIGYFPDVGVTRVLARLDGKVGQYLGMTGARITGEEAYLAGLATHYISSSQIDLVAQRLANLPAESAFKPNTVASALLEFSADPLAKRDVLSKSALLGDRRIALDYVFGRRSVEAIYASLDDIAQGKTDSLSGIDLGKIGMSAISDEVKQWAADTLATLKTKSPRSLKVTLQAINEARRHDVEEAFRSDMRLATSFCDFSLGRDFYTGVTHVLEKDPQTGKRREGIAKWEPATLEQVSDDDIQRQFFFAAAKGADKTAAKGGKLNVPELSQIPPLSSSDDARVARDRMLQGIAPLGWEPSHNIYALPSEAECAALLAGYHPAASAVTPDESEMIDCLKRHKGHLPALEFKVKDWLQRRNRRSS